DQLAFSVGNIVAVQYLRDISTAQARVMRGSIAVGLEPGESSPLPDAGVAANIKLDNFNIDAWEKVFSSTVGSSPVAVSVAASGTAQQALSYLPNQIAIRAKELLVGGRKLNNLVIGGSRDGPTWRANLDATELNGYLEFRQPGSTNAGRIFARLSRLSLAQSTANDVESILDGQPASVPALDIVVDDLDLRGKKLGRIEVDAVNRASTTNPNESAAREWRLNKLNVVTPEAVFTATGNWVAINAQAPAAGPRVQRPVAERRRTVMNFKLDIADSGLLLKRFGMADVVRRGKGKMEGSVAWAGSPLGLDYPSMSGQFNVNIESGQFLKADPGLAKLLGVLSLQSLPRRLTLDFRDVFSEGFAFDFVRGDVGISQGVASTNNLQMKGVNAAVLMEGSADIAKETQDLKVVVVPEINAGTASLIATVINPAIGLGTFLAQYFLRRPLIQAATQEFHIDGSWSDPKVTKVEKKP
ncbi:MAG: TIGR02099 family protein, partial [Polaromonas sp.]|nr:TIGR02099 family protein [Polaromonas sp.]